MKKIRIIKDFVCPYCFVAEEIMWKVLGKDYKNFQFEWLPYELTPEPQELKKITAEKKEYFLSKIAPWAEKEGIKVNFPGVDPVPRTSLAFEGLHFAQEFDLHCEYVKNVMEAYWIEGKDIGKIDVLTEVAKKVGLDGGKFKADLERGKYREEHKKRNEEVSGWDFEVVPTFYIDEKQIEEFPRNSEDMKKIFV